jgi:hypothetical protein
MTVFLQRKTLECSELFWVRPSVFRGFSLFMGVLKPNPREKRGMSVYGGMAIK